MKNATLAAIFVAAAAGAVQAHVIVPLGDLTDMVPQTDYFVSGQDNFDAPATWRVYTFSALAGDAIQVHVDRLAAGADPIAYAHLGDLTGADVPDGSFASDLGAFGLTLVGAGDDDVDDPFGGPFGDPHFGFTAPADGTYTVITHMFGDYPDNPPYSIQVIGSTAPAPGAAGLLALGGAFAARRRRPR